MSAEQTPDIERVLAEHTPFLVPNHASSIYPVQCGCTFGPDRADLPAMGWLQWSAHVAQALAPVLTAVREQRAEHEPLEEVVRDLLDNDFRHDHPSALQGLTSPTCPRCRLHAMFPPSDFKKFLDGSAERAATSGKESEVSDE